MQMKGLSPESQNIVEDDLVRKREVSTTNAVETGEAKVALPGSKATV